MPIRMARHCPWGKITLIFLAMLVVARKAQSANLELATNRSYATASRPGGDLTNAFDWSSIAATETRVASYDLRTTRPAKNNSLSGRLIGEFRSIQLRAFQEPYSEPTVIFGAALDARPGDDSDLLSFRLGPWLESSLTEKILLQASGGFVLGLLDVSTGWTGASLLAESSLASHANRAYFKVASGLYAGVDAIYHISERWGIGIGAKFQNLVFSNHNFSERPASLNWSKCIMVQAGFSYSF